MVLFFCICWFELLLVDLNPISECGNAFSKPNDNWFYDSCGKAVYGHSFAGENFGDDFCKVLEDRFSSDYYLKDSDHGEKEIQTINKLEESNLSPGSKIVDDFITKQSVLNQDWGETDRSNYCRWKSGMKEQALDLLKFQLDNTEVSRENFVFWNKRNS